MFLCVTHFLSLLIMMIWGLFQTLYVFSSNRIYFSHGKIIQPWLTTMLFIYANKKTQNSFLWVGIGLGVSFFLFGISRNLIQSKTSKEKNRTYIECKMPIPITIRDYRLLLNTKIPNWNQIPQFLVKNDQFYIETEFLNIWKFTFFTKNIDFF